MRRDAKAAVRDRCHHGRHLHRRHQERSLADGDRDGFARVPRRAACLEAPSGSAPTRLLAAHVDPGRQAEAEQPGVARDALDAQPLAELVEVDVARSAQGVAQVDAAVALAFPTAVGMVVEVRHSAAHHAFFRRDHILESPAMAMMILKIEPGSMFCSTRFCKGCSARSGSAATHRPAAGGRTGWGRTTVWRPGRESRRCADRAPPPRRRDRPWRARRLVEGRCRG